MSRQFSRDVKINRLTGEKIFASEKKKPRHVPANKALAKKEERQVFKTSTQVIRWLPAGAPKKPFMGTPRFPKWFYDGVFYRSFPRMSSFLPRDVVRVDLARAYNILTSYERTKKNATRDEGSAIWLSVTEDKLVRCFECLFSDSEVEEDRGRSKRILDMYSYVKSVLDEAMCVRLSEILEFQVRRPRTLDEEHTMPKTRDRVLVAVRRPGDEEPIKMVFDAEEYKACENANLPRNLMKPKLGLRGGVSPPTRPSRPAVASETVNPMHSAPVDAGRPRRRENLNKRGTGGKSKLKKPPQAKVKVSEKGDKVKEDKMKKGGDSEIDELLKLIGEEENGKFMFSRESRQKCLLDMTDNMNDPEFYDFDCNGSPFCGFVCIDVATGFMPKFREYSKMLAEGENPLDLGNESYLDAYAGKRGVNLKIWVYERGVIGRGGFRPIYQCLNSYAFKTVHLAYYVVGSEGEGEDMREIGHYTLFCQKISDEAPNVIPPLVVETTPVKVPLNGLLRACFFTISALPFMFLFLMVMVFVVGESKVVLFPLMAKVYEGVVMILEFLVDEFFPFLTPFLDLIPSWNTILFACLFRVWWRNSSDIRKVSIYHRGRSFNNASNNDVRGVSDRRDRLMYQDCYVEFTKKSDFEFEDTGNWLNLVTFGFLYFYNALVLSVFKESLHYYAYMLTGVKLLAEEKFIVSAVRFADGYVKAQECVALGVEPKKCLSGVFMKREVNSDISIPSLFLDTCRLLEEECSMLPFAKRAPDHDLTIFNANNGQSLIAKEDRIIEGQIRGERLKGGCNYIRRHTLKDPKKKILSDAPIGAPLSLQGILGCGQLSLTDSPGLLAAFTVRSMTAAHSVPESIKEFISFSLRFLSHMVEGTDVKDLIEPKITEYFPLLYRGKKTQVYIQQVMDKYEKHLHNELSLRDKFYKCGAFVKMESNAKFSGDDPANPLQCKPRLIMTMSDLMLCELCPCMILIDRWNHGPFSKFQIKDMSVADMIDKIVELSDRPHMVTDYSSFESSISMEIRKLENTVLIKLCERAGFSRLRRFVYEFYCRGRTLTTKYGQFYIESRCSGDFVTSFGNGIVNVCLSAYSAYKRGVPLKMIAEGDDGLMASEIAHPDLLGTLGFTFSESLMGTRPGDCDFLRSRWVDGKRYLNICRMLRVFWVTDANELRRSKKLYLLRAAANSLYHLSPGHPVLTAAVNRILRLTAGHSNFKTSMYHLDKWHGLNYGEVGIKRIEVDESMRALIAEGAIGFPGISIVNQLALEHALEFEDTMFIGDILNEYEDFQPYVKSYKEQDFGEYRVSHEYYRFVKKLIEAGADVNIQTSEFSGVEPELGLLEDLLEHRGVSAPTSVNQA